MRRLKMVVERLFIAGMVLTFPINASEYTSYISLSDKRDLTRQSLDDTADDLAVRFIPRFPIFPGCLFYGIQRGS